MNRKKIILLVFILVALVQLYVPAKMVVDMEDLLENGTEYKFKTIPLSAIPFDTIPINRRDPFRGKFIMLRFEEEIAQVQNKKDWIRNDVVYVVLTTDSSGFAKVEYVSKDQPKNDKDFVRAKVLNANNNNFNEIAILYHFNHYYIEESKLSYAKKIYRESLKDTDRVTYALVKVKDGNASLKDVLINDTSISEILKEKR